MARRVRRRGHELRGLRPPGRAREGAAARGRRRGARQGRLNTNAAEAEAPRYSNAAEGRRAAPEGGQGGRARCLRARHAPPRRRSRRPPRARASASARRAYPAPATSSRRSSRAARSRRARAAVCGCGGALSLFFGGVVLAHGLLDAAADGAVLARWAGRRAITAGGGATLPSPRPAAGSSTLNPAEGVGLGPRGVGRGRRRDEGGPGAGPKGRPGRRRPARRPPRRCVADLRPSPPTRPLLRAGDQGEKQRELEVLVDYGEVVSASPGPRAPLSCSTPRKVASTVNQAPPAACSAPVSMWPVKRLSRLAG